jgi:hypothetical protein
MLERKSYTRATLFPTNDIWHALELNSDLLVENTAVGGLDYGYRLVIRQSLSV